MCVGGAPSSKKKQRGSGFGNYVPEETTFPTQASAAGAPGSAATDPRRKEDARARLRKGRRSTMLTGPLGLQNQANIQRKTLLGL